MCKEKNINKLLDKLNDCMQKHISPEQHTDLVERVNVIPAEIMARFLQNKNMGNSSRAEYPEELRTFAISLHFYSPKAYQYVRQVFCNALPSIGTIRTWYSSVDAEPGFLKESFDLLKKKAEDKPIYVALCFDEIAIKRYLEGGAGDTVRGFVDLGTGDCSDEMAVDALVFIVTSFEEDWKLPVAYFLIKSMIAETRCNLVTEIISRLYEESNIIVASVTCDGPHTNVSTLAKLGK